MSAAILREIDPGNVIITSGLNGSPRYHGRNAVDDPLARLYEAGAGDAFDIVAIHTYNTGDPTMPLYYLHEWTRVMREHGDGDKKIWVTETGFAAARDGDSDTTTQESEERKAHTLDMMYGTLIHHPNVDKVFWWKFRSWTPRPWITHGLAYAADDGEHFRPLPAYEAYKAVPKLPTERRYKPDVFGY
jgi:hypothetical protein